MSPVPDLRRATFTPFLRAYRNTFPNASRLTLPARRSASPTSPRSAARGEGQGEGLLIETPSRIGTRPLSPALSSLPNGGEGGNCLFLLTARDVACSRFEARDVHTISSCVSEHVPERFPSHAPRPSQRVADLSPQRSAGRGPGRGVAYRNTKPDWNAPPLPGPLLPSEWRRGRQLPVSFDRA